MKVKLDKHGQLFLLIPNFGRVEFNGLEDLKEKLIKLGFRQPSNIIDQVHDDINILLFKDIEEEIAEDSTQEESPEDSEQEEVKEDPIEDTDEFKPVKRRVRKTKDAT